MTFLLMAAFSPVSKTVIRRRRIKGSNPSPSAQTKRFPIGSRFWSGACGLSNRSRQSIVRGRLQKSASFASLAQNWRTGRTTRGFGKARPSEWVASPIAARIPASDLATTRGRLWRRKPPALSLPPRPSGDPSAMAPTGPPDQSHDFRPLLNRASNGRRSARQYRRPRRREWCARFKRSVAARGRKGHKARAG
jgi:hypothetical protein